MDGSVALLQAKKLIRGVAGEVSDVSERIDQLPYGLNYKGAVNYYSDLPTGAAAGDTYNVLYSGTSGEVPDGTMYAWGSNSGTDTWIAVNIVLEPLTEAEVKQIWGDA